MAVTLVVNPGSSSKKYALYEGRELRFSAHIERSESGFEMCTVLNRTEQKCAALPETDYHGSLVTFIDQAVAGGVIASLTAITKVAVRIVAPGTYFQSHRRVDPDFMKRLQAVLPTAPLHIPHIVRELDSLRATLPQAAILGISDSAFHATMAGPAHHFSLLREEATALDLYRFGYHGLSVSSVVKRAGDFWGGVPERLVVCHLGSGVSVTAVRAGQSVDTTMGYAPGSGLLMGSRAGDLDTGALLALMVKRNLKPLDAATYLQTSGGLKALAGESDLRLLLDRRAQGEPTATAAIDHYAYHLRKAIGAQLAVLGGADALVCTATAGERSPILRSLILLPLAPLGLCLDNDMNDQCVSRDGVISTPDSPTKILVLKTDEAFEILLASERVG